MKGMAEAKMRVVNCPIASAVLAVDPGYLSVEIYFQWCARKQDEVKLANLRISLRVFYLGCPFVSYFHFIILFPILVYVSF